MLDESGSWGLAVLEAELTQHDVACIGVVATIILAENAEVVQMFVAPIKEELEHEVELGQRGVAPHQEAAPDEGADASQDDTQLIDGRRFYWLAHRVSVAQCVVSLKASPRNLALSRITECSRPDIGWLCRKVGFWRPHPKIRYQKINDLRVSTFLFSVICDRAIMPPTGAPRVL